MLLRCTPLAAALIAALPTLALADQQHSLPVPTTQSDNYSPFARQTFPNRVYFGDTHLHTAYSADAGLAGARLGPDAAYRFAKGEAVVSSLGVPARLQRPLDFLVVADHAENLACRWRSRKAISGCCRASGAARSTTRRRRARSRA
jgi:hypothetical protein